MLRFFFISVLGCFVMMSGLSCLRESDVTLRYEKKLFAPLTEQDICLLLQDCDSKKELLERCGTPLHVEVSKGVEHIEFMVSFDKMQGSTPFMIASFVVVVSNDTVVSWLPNSTARIR